MKRSFIPNTLRQSAPFVNPGGYSSWRLRRFAPVLIPLLALTILFTLLSRPVIATAQPAGEPAAASILQSRNPLSNTGTLGQIYLPVLLRPAQGQEAAAPTPTATPLTPTATPASPAEPPREWDPRLDARGTTLREANAGPGQGYWRLVRAVWYDEQQSQGRHHIFLDAIDQNGNRIVGLPIKVYWNGGSATVTTQAKPGEPYAADFGMFALAPAYGATPADANPADDVWGMGLGSVEQPNYAIHTSYGLVWQWTVKPNQEPAPTATATPAPTLEPTATPTDSPGATPTATPTATPVTPTSTPTPTATPGSPYLFSRAELVRCDPNGGNTYVQGTVRLDGQPANGYRVVFSWAPDGPIVAGITSGPHDGYPGWNPGYYSHILQAGGPRQGDWWFWIVDAWNVRISEMAYVHTDGAVNASSCQQAVIDFDSR